MIPNSPINNLFSQNLHSIWNFFKATIYDSILYWHNVLPFYLWTIWNIRNNNTSNNKKIPPEFQHAYSQAIIYKLLIMKDHYSLIRETINLRWIPPNNNGFKLNTDGSYFGNPHKEGIGGVIRTSNGGWVLSFCKSFHNSSNNMMELMDLNKGLKIVEQNNSPSLKKKRNQHRLLGNYLYAY